MLQLKNLTVSVGKKTIIDGFNFTYEKGKIYAVMGPNGSGKSTLSLSIMGHPTYMLKKESRIMKDGKRIDNIDANKRSAAGLFLSFQTPLSLSGITIHQLLQLALSGKKDPLQIRQETEKYAKELKISDELLKRSLNDGASGGEKKKLEVLQAAVLDKDILIFDEIDTGVDVDALRTISKFLDKHRKDKTYILITHYNRILHYLKPDKVLVLVNGKLVKVGDHTLAQKIEKEGYAKHT